MKINTSKRMFAVGGLLAVLLSGCVTVSKDADGFVAFDGRMEQSAPSDYFILRFERPDGVYDRGWQKGLTKWIFTEVRQLKEGTTVVADGVLKPSTRQIAPCNWAKWISPGARNVRVKFVGADYTLAKDGRMDAPSGFVPLYNGRDLTGWQGRIVEKGRSGPEWIRALPPDVAAEKQAVADAAMRAHWTIRDGVVFFDGLPGGTSIVTKKDYHNFELLADWRLLRVYGDSGFYVRGLPQIQIWDPHTWGGQGSGGMWNNRTTFFGATSCEDRPIGDWNTFRVRMVDDKVTVWLNDVKVVDAVPLQNESDPKKPIPFLEHIHLQCHGDPIEFRNLFIRELP